MRHWAGFIDKLEYRRWWNGITFEKVDRWFPSTKTCSECGAVRPNMALSERTFICHSCGVMLDRDLNAARNLENAESFPASGRGAEIRLGGVDRPVAAEKRQKTATGDNHRLSSIGIGSQERTRPVFLGEIPGRSRLELLGRRRGRDRVSREG